MQFICVYFKIRLVLYSNTSSDTNKSLSNLDAQSDFDKEIVKKKAGQVEPS